MVRLAVLLTLLFPLAAEAQISTGPKPIFQGHNGSDWVATYGCKDNPTETTQLISALKQALAAKDQGAVTNGIQQAKANYPGCVIGTSTDWQSSDSYQ